MDESALESESVLVPRNRVTRSWSKRSIRLRLSNSGEKSAKAQITKKALTVQLVSGHFLRSF